LDYLMETLKESLMESLKYKEERLKTLDLQVFRRSINERAEFFKYRADSLIRSNSRAFSSMIGMMEERKENFMRMLEDLNPKNIMRKGYSVVTDENGIIINSTVDLAKDQQVTLIMSDGEADSLISEVRRNKK
ncbi:MAG TPA: exodeoxyribonuclease VII large subunit, partial [Bacillota bacterium]|nr:exodeoxyribonuclease VII large subunit [Bacillota bacterium]